MCALTTQHATYTTFEDRKNLYAYINNGMFKMYSACCESYTIKIVSM